MIAEFASAVEAVEVLTANPEVTLASLDEAYSDPADLDHLLEGLRKAGLTD